MSSNVRPCGVNIFKTLIGLRDRWADDDETWRVYSMVLGTQLLGSGILNSPPPVPRGTTKLARSGEMTQRGAYRDVRKGGG